MSKLMEVRGLDELQQRMQRFPQKFADIMGTTMGTSLLILLENVPGYPPKPPNSSYERTGTLGRSIGIGGQPDIFSVRKLGYGMEGKIGTRLHYAEKVIGDKGKQSPFFAQYWWRLESVAGKSYGKILGEFKKAAALMARFLEGK